MGFPIRKSAGQSLFPTHRSLSQVIASFFGSQCQGIHLTLFFAWTAVLLFSSASLFRKKLRNNSAFIAWASQIIVWVVNLKDLLVFLIHWLLSAIRYISISYGWRNCSHFVTEKPLYFFRYNKFFSIYNYLFRFFSLFGFQWTRCKLLLAGGDDGIRFSRGLRARSSSVANVHRKFALYRFPFESALGYNEPSALFVTWWRWWDSNPWPPACRAGALPTELHPHL